MASVLKWRKPRLYAKLREILGEKRLPFPMAAYTKDDLCSIAQEISFLTHVSSRIYRPRFIGGEYRQFW